jgi:predicted DCC family thiol-disulfide oxidoreductase YuxK
VKSHDAHVTFAVPALFDNNNSNQQEQRPIVLFDGACTLCNSFVQFLLKYDRYGNLRFAALQSKVGELLLRRMSQEVRDEVLHQAAAGGEGKGSEGEDGEKYKSIVLCTPDETYIQSSAVLKILAALSSSSSSSTSTSSASTSSANIKPSKRMKLLQYLGLIGYIIPTKLRDSMYKYISKRRKSWFGSADECMLYDERFDDRFVDDGVLTGIYRDPFANPDASPLFSSSYKEEGQDEGVVTNLFESDNPPKRGDQVQIIWPTNTNLDPSITYDDEFPNGLCLIGGRGTISTIDLPMRIVLRVERKSLGLDERDVMGDETMIAWVNPTEVALV